MTVTVNELSAITALGAVVGYILGLSINRWKAYRALDERDMLAATLAALMDHINAGQMPSQSWQTVAKKALNIEGDMP